MKTATIANLPQASIEDEHTGLSKEALKRAFLDNLFYIQGKFPALATMKNYYMALAYTVRDRLLQRWVNRRRPIPATVPAPWPISPPNSWVSHHKRAVHRVIVGRAKAQRCPTVSQFAAVHVGHVLCPT